MEWSDVLFQVIDLRSFSSLWYWIVVVVVWSSASHWVLGVPYDLISRARRQGGQAYQDFSDLVRINVNRILLISGAAGLIATMILCFLLTSLLILGFFYGLELAQALLLLLAPVSLVVVLSLSTARKIAETQPEGEALFSVLGRHRLWTQIIGMVAIFITAMYGMYENLSAVRSL